MNINDAQRALIDRIELTSRGDGHIVFANSRLADGVYYYALFVDGRMVDTKQMILSK